MNSKLQKSLWVLVLILTRYVGIGQVSFSESDLEDIRLYVDTTVYSWESDVLFHQQKEYLPFQYQEEEEVAEVYLYFGKEAVFSLELLQSKDFEVLDSLLMVDDHARFKVRFRELTDTDFLKFTFKITKSDSSLRYVDVPLFPYTTTNVAYYPPEGPLFIGEEKVTEIITNRPENIVFDNRWTEGLPINYRVDKRGNDLRLYLEPARLGYQTINVPLGLKRPNVVDGKVTYALPNVTHDFEVKSGRLTFLQLDEQEITPFDDPKQPIEVQVQHHRYLQMGKTYRIENQEEKGGALIAELFTKNRLNNDKVLCLLRVYAHHRRSEGYLYLKDGDDPKFVMNVDITPKSKIHAISLQREGKNWEKSNEVFPGENLNVRIEGVALHKSSFRFLGVEYNALDSAVRTEDFALFNVRVPLDITANRIDIFDRSSSTGNFLKVSEYQRPKELDFVKLELGEQTHTVSHIDRPIYYEGTLSDFVINFDRDVIDVNRDLNGKQYLYIKVKVSNKEGNLIELYQFDDVVICPDASSIRTAHYKDSNCQPGSINLNDFLSRKTYNLDEWSRIELQIGHQKDKYKEQSPSKRVIVYLKREYNFDIDVSFPGGLLILKKENGERDFTNFSGVSFAMLAQFSFYQPGKIAKYQPYKIGAGFIAIDAFNFSESAANRDVGLVVIGSVYPSASANKKLTFPLYAGFGYLMKEEKFFQLIGPGIRVKF